MGETISTLVFRPPIPTPIRVDKFFYIRLPKSSASSSSNQNNECGCMSMPSDMGMFSNFDDEEEEQDDDILDKNNDDTFNENDDNNIQNDIHKKTYFNHHNPKSNHIKMYSALNMQGEEDYNIPAFFLRRKDAKVTILFSHGNAEDLGMMYRRMKDIAIQLCANVLAYDYTGYGLSTPANSQPSEAMCYRNIEAAYNHLTNVMKIPPSQIILYGRSLGSGPSCYLAKKTADEGSSVAGLILHSPFLSIYRIVLDFRVNLVGDMFINRSRAKDIRCPVLIIHGTEDEVVPFWHADELLRSFRPQYRAQPYWVDGLGHNQIEIKRKNEYTRKVKSFIAKYVIPSIDGRSSKPTCVPEHEQYKPEQSLRDSGKFIVNQTWMRHGVAIVNEAMQMKKKGPPPTVTKTEKQKDKVSLHSIHSSQPKQLHDSTNNGKLCNIHIEPNQTNLSQRVQLDRVDTEDLLAKVKHAQSYDIKSASVTTYAGTSKTRTKLKEAGPINSYHLSRNDSIQSAESVASRYIITKESWATTDDEADVSFDNVKENMHEKVSKIDGVSLQTFSSDSVNSMNSSARAFKRDCDLNVSLQSTSLSSMKSSTIQNTCDVNSSLQSSIKSGNLYDSPDRYYVSDAYEFKVQGNEHNHYCF